MSTPALSGVIFDSPARRGGDRGGDLTLAVRFHACRLKQLRRVIRAAANYRFHSLTSKRRVNENGAPGTEEKREITQSPNKALHIVNAEGKVKTVSLRPVPRAYRLRLHEPELFRIENLFGKPFITLGSTRILFFYLVEYALQLNPPSAKSAASAVTISARLAQTSSISAAFRQRKESGSGDQHTGGHLVPSAAISPSRPPVSNIAPRRSVHRAVVKIKLADLSRAKKAEVRRGDRSDLSRSRKLSESRNRK
jgi:hypothetical protein